MKSLLYDNRRLLTLAIALICVAGLSASMVLPRMEDPTLTKRVAIVDTLYQGAKADRVESLVTEVIEKELEEIPEIKELKSTSRTGISTITIELKDNVYESEEIWSRVRDKIADAEPLLPPGASEPRFDDLEVSAYAAIYAIVWSLPDSPSNAILRRNAEELQQQLLGVSGTREVDLFGEPDEEILVEISQSTLASIGLSVREVAKQIKASDAKQAAGQIRDSKASLLIEVDTELDSLERIASIPIRTGADGQWLRLGDLATLRKEVRRPVHTAALIDGKPSIAVGVYIRDDIRVDHWAKNSQSVVAQFADSLPPGLELVSVFEQSPYVERRLSSLLSNLGMSAAGVMLVILLMMGWRSAIVVGSVLPLASLMVLAGMQFLEIPIHQMSVTGLIVALGLLIDNAIVMTDEVRGRIRDGAEPRIAIQESFQHLSIPLLGSTVTTALSFAPIALMPGPAGEFVGSIAVSVILAVVSSFVLAMTITPAITAMLSNESVQASRHWWQRGLELPWLQAIYSRTILELVRRPALAIVIAIILPITGFFAATTLPEQFFPPADRDQFYVQVELPANSSIEATTETIQSMRKSMLNDVAVERVDWFVGESAPSFYYNLIMKMRGVPQYAQAIVKLNAGYDDGDTIRRLQTTMDRQFPESRTLVRQLEQGPPFDAPIEVRLFGPDVDTLNDLGRQLRGVLAQTPDVLHTASDLGDSLSKLSVEIDETKARLAGLDNEEIALQLDAALEGVVGGSILEATEELPVRVRVSQERRGAVDELASLDLVNRNAISESLPLSSVANLKLNPEISAIPHFNRQRINEIRGYITAGVLPDTVLTRFRDELARQDFQLPPGYRIEYGGEADKRDQAVGNLMASMGVLLVLMATTLVLSFNSFRMASIIAVSGLLSIGLGLGSLAVLGYPFGFMAIIGSMGLAGVAINDSIVVLAALREDPLARTGEPSAVRDVTLKSSRHVFSTTLTTVAGFLPLLLDKGDFWPPLAATIAGGVLGATMLALVLVPAAHVLFSGATRRAEQQVPESATMGQLWVEPPKQPRPMPQPIAVS